MSRAFGSRQHGMMRLPLPWLLPLLLLAPLSLGGCAIVGLSAGSDLDDAARGEQVSLADASRIEPGMPLEVGLPDQGWVRGIHLGTRRLDASADPADTSLGAEAIVLGVGNRPLIDRLFSKRRALAVVTTADAPDTLVLPLDRVRSLTIPVTRHGAITGAAAGAVTDITLGTILIYTLGVTVAGVLIGIVFRQP